MQCKHGYTASDKWTQGIEFYVCLFEQIGRTLLSSIEACSSRLNWEKKCKYKQINAVAHACASSRECFVQEALYHCLLDVRLRKFFAGVIYANTNLAEKRLKMLPSHEEMSQLLDERENTFKNNMLDSYMERPDGLLCNNHWPVPNNFCYAEFLRYYYLAPHVK